MHLTPIHPGVYKLTVPYLGGGIVYTYLLKGERVALVDTGATDSPRRILQPALAEIGLSLADVDLLLTTHAHLDHSGGNLETKQLSGAPIYMHAAEGPMARSTEVQVEFHTAPLRALGFPAETVRERADYVAANAGESVEPDLLLSAGEIVDLGAGMEFRALHTPGHTPGHLCFYWEREGVLLTGDAVQGQGARPGAYPYYFEACDYRRSLDALARLDIQLLGAGHAFPGGSPVNDPVRTGEDARAFLRESIRIADAIHRAVEGALRRLPGAGKREVAFAALDELIYDIPQLRLRTTGMPLLAGPTLLAHIDAALAGSYPA